MSYREVVQFNVPKARVEILNKGGAAMLPFGPRMTKMSKKKKQVAPAKANPVVDKADPEIEELLRTLPSSSPKNKYDFPFEEGFLDKATGELRLEDRTEEIKTGGSVPPLDGPQIRLSYRQGQLALIGASNDQLTNGLANLMGEVFTTFDCSNVLKYFEKSEQDVVFSFGDNGHHFLDRLEHNTALTLLLVALLELADSKMQLASEFAIEKDRWTFSYRDLFALTFDSCQPSDVGMGSRMLEEFREQYKEVQQARKDIDAMRQKWLREQAEPLLDTIGEQLSEASLPDGYRDELCQLRAQLIKDAYYQGIIETSDVAEQLDVVEELVRRLARQGRLGLSLSRHYVFSADEVKHFSKKPRPTGIHKKSP